jgi:hypothetical protein
MPAEAQRSPIYAIEVSDIDQDGIKDILVGGNLYEAKPEVGRYDALRGALLRGDGDGAYTYVNDQKSGVNIDGQIRDIELITIKGKQYFMIARNNDSILFYGNE